MIHSNELRIGNFVNDTRTVGNRCGMPPVFHPKKVKKIDEYDIDYFDPIQLTPEILEKCGFNKDNYGVFCLVKDGGRYVSGCKILLWVKFVGTTLQVCTGEEFGNLFELCRILYLHQLQNLYFSLTGKELNLTI